MRFRRTALPACGFLLFLFAPLLVPQQPAATTPAPPAASQVNNVKASQLSRDQMEQFLLNARIIGERPAPKGVTHTRRLVLTDGHWVHDAHVQTIDIYLPEFRSKEGVEKNFRDSYKFNIAAYRLDKMMDLGFVPVCVPREIDGKPAAVDWWVDDVMFDEEGRRDRNVEPPDENSWVRQLNLVRDFDQLIYNVDRNQGNLLIDKAWKLWAIDHSRSFRENMDLRDTKVLRRVSNKMLNSMRALNQPDLEAQLMPFISKEAVAAVLVRRDLLLKFFENEVNTKGPDAVILDLPRHTPIVTIP